MKEKEITKDKEQDVNKKEWIAPKLFCLDKGKTEGGGLESFAEGTEYDGTLPS